MKFLIRSTILLGVLICVVLSFDADGGLGGDLLGDADAERIADSVKPQVQARLGANKPMHEYVVVSYRKQVVAGINYFLKIRIAPHKYIHARVFKPLDSAAAVELHGLEQDKQRQDPINYVDLS